MTILHDTDSLRAHSTVAAIGMFDGVHLGHLHTLDTLCREARANRRQSLVVTFIQHPQHVLCPGHPLPLIMPLAERLQLIGQAGVDMVLVLEFSPRLAALTAGRFMGLLRDRWGVDRVVMGFNHRFGSDCLSAVEDYQRCEREEGVVVVRATEYPQATVSSSIIRRLIAAGDVRGAARLLGRPFAIEGRVVHGEHLGSSLGFPTANVGEWAEHQLLPAPGAYAVHALCGGRSYDGMAGVGHRPTVSRGTETSVEVNLFDCHATLYGEPMRVEFVDFLRPEAKFGSEEALRRQLSADREAAIKVLTENNQQ